MANLILGAPLYNDVGVLYTPAYSGGSWEAGNPLNNLRDRRMFTFARSSSVAETATRAHIDLGTDRPVRVGMVPRHTLSSGAKWRITGRQSSDLFSYIAGEDLTARGAVFSRTGTATFVDRGGVLRTAATGVARDGHWLNGERTLLLEPARENLCIRSEEFDTWTGFTSGSATPNTTTAPDGNLTGDTIISGAIGGGVFRNVTFTADGEKCAAVYLRAGTSTRSQVAIRDGTAAADRHRVRVTWTAGVPSLTTESGAGTLYPVEALANGWYRILFSATGVIAANSNNVQVVADSIGTGTVIAWGFQAENAVVPSSYIPTTGTTVTRNADSLYFPFTAVPQAMTVYVRGNNRSAYVAESVAKRVLHIGSATTTSNPRFSMGYSTGNNPFVQFDDGTTNRSVTPSAGTIARGATVEHRGVLRANGEVISAASINGGAEAVSSASATGGLGSAFADTRLYLTGGLSSDNAQFAYTHVIVRTGEQSLDTMRASYVDSGWLDAWAAGDTLETRQGQNLALTYIVASTAPQCRYWTLQISDPSNAAGYVDLHRLCLAGGFQPSTNFSEGSSFGLESDSVTTYADGGNGIHDVRPLRRVARFSTRNVEMTEALTQFLVQQVNMGARGQCVVVPEPDDAQGLMQRRAFLAVPRELTALEYTQAAFGHYSIGFVEEL